MFIISLAIVNKSTNVHYCRSNPKHSFNSLIKFDPKHPLWYVIFIETHSKITECTNQIEQIVFPETLYECQILLECFHCHLIQCSHFHVRLVCVSPAQGLHTVDQEEELPDELESAGKGLYEVSCSQIVRFE